MKNITITLLLAVLFNMPAPVMAQQVNWRSLQQSRPHFINVHAGFDYGASVGIGYGQKLKTSLPLVLSAGYTMPAGKKLTDDFKAKLGGQAEVLKLGHFSTTVKAYGLFRRYESGSVKLSNFGSEFSAVFGFYKRRWYAAGEFGFDKAIITHVKHKPVMKESFPEIQDGWYIPTGGNFIYGVQTGASFGNNDVYVRVGKTLAQDLKNKAAIPLYFQLGLNTRF